jgi:hypothetical protein
VLFTTVTHLPVALLIALEHALATGGGGVVASSPPQAANSMMLFDANARRNARLPSDGLLGILALGPFKQLKSDTWNLTVLGVYKYELVKQYECGFEKRIRVIPPRPQPAPGADRCVVSHCSSVVTLW